MPPFPAPRPSAWWRSRSGARIDELFVEFSEPIAAASIAQVHQARIARPDGERRCAVKVVRPGVREGFARDLQAMRAAARLFERWVPDASACKPVEIVDALARSVSVEMDLRLEAAARLRAGARTPATIPISASPKPEWDLTARDVLTITWIDGIRLNDLRGHRGRGPRPWSRSAARVIQSFLRHAIRDGFFHADMHPGNLFVDDQGRLVAVDFGIMGRLGMKERRFLAEILLGFIQRDYLPGRAGAFRGRLRAAAPFGRGFRAGASAPSASRSTIAAPTRSRWRSC